MDLISRMIVLDPEQRISIPEILNHPWMQETVDGFSDNDTLDFENGLNRGEFSLNAIQPGKDRQCDINQVNIDNIFPNEHIKTKLSYNDYLSIT